MLHFHTSIVLLMHTQMFPSGLFHSQFTEILNHDKRLI